MSFKKVDIDCKSSHINWERSVGFVASIEVGDAPVSSWNGSLNHETTHQPNWPDPYASHTSHFFEQSYAIRVVIIGKICNALICVQA
jgi:hypothetical protein